MFTDRYIRNLRPEAKIKDIGEKNGFGVRVRLDGTKVFFYRYNSPVTAVRRFIVLGEYPELSLENARIKYHTAYKSVKAGIDPLEVALNKQVERNAAPTVKILVEDYARQKFPDTWQEKVKEYNQEYMGPGTPSEVSNIIKGLLKKEYFYKCNDQPLAAHCDKNACRKRKFGIGNAVPDYISELNHQFFVSMEGNKVFVFSERYDPELNRNNLIRISFNSFREFHNHQSVVIGTKPDGLPILKSRGSAWLEHEHRRQFDGVMLAPDEKYLQPNFYNLWKGFGVKAAKGRWKLMRDHLFYVICNADDSCFQYLMRWLATCVQQPSKPAEVAVVLRGAKGSGKGIIGQSLCKIFGNNGLHISSAKHLVGNFNNHLRSCIFLFADESFWAGDKQHESVLKALITEPTITIESKGVDVISVRNMLHILMASNSD